MATWTVHVEDGPKRVNHAAACINGLIYSFGGYCTGEDFGRRRDIDIHVFNTCKLRTPFLKTYKAHSFCHKCF